MNLFHFQRDALRWWELSFRLGKVTSTALGLKGRQFAVSIQTDGVECSESPQKPITVPHLNP